MVIHCDGCGNGNNEINLVGDPVPSVPCVLKVDEEVEEENIKLVMLRYETLVGEP